MVQRAYNAFAVRVVSKEGDKRQVLPFHDISEGEPCIEMRIRLYPDGAMSNLLKQLIKVCACVSSRCLCVCSVCGYMLSLYLCLCVCACVCVFGVSSVRCDCVACNRTRPKLAFPWYIGTLAIA